MPPPAIKLLAFAVAREAVGAGEQTFPLEPPVPVTARALLDRLCDAFPPLAPHRGSLRLAVNGAYAEWDQEVVAGDEVALIPPVSGG